MVFLESVFTSSVHIKRFVFAQKSQKDSVVWCGEQRVSTSCWMWDVSALSVQGHIFSLLCLGSLISTSTSVNLTGNSIHLLNWQKWVIFVIFASMAFNFYVTFSAFFCFCPNISCTIYDLRPHPNVNFQNSMTNVQITDTIENSIKLQLNMAEKSLRNWYLDFKPDIGSN